MSVYNLFNLQTGIVSSPLGQPAPCKILEICQEKDASKFLNVFEVGPDSKIARRLLRRCMVINGRRQDTDVRMLAESILSGGVVLLFRGIPIAVSTCTGDAYDMIVGASLCEAIIVAYQIDPENPFVRDVMDRGLERFIVLKKDTSRAAKKWLKSEQDNYHLGSSLTIIEVYEGVPCAELGWTSHKKDHTITVSSCPKTGDYRYEKCSKATSRRCIRCSEIGSTSMLSKWDHKLEHLEIWDWYKNLLESPCEYLNVHLNNSALGWHWTCLLSRRAVGLADASIHRYLRI